MSICKLLFAYYISWFSVSVYNCYSRFVCWLSRVARLLYIEMSSYTASNNILHEKVVWLYAKQYQLLSYIASLRQAGLKVGHTCWPTWHTDPLCNPDVTKIWPTCDPHTKVFFLQNDMENSDMKQCHIIDVLFLYGRIQNWSHVQPSCEQNLQISHALKQLKVVTI